MEEYVDTYDKHHLTNGLSGSGTSQPEDKMRLINQSGLTGSCLDYGCGWGMMADYFDDYVGVDISKTAIGYARVQNREKEFHVIENGKLDLGRKFDFAICLSVFTHCLDDHIEKIFSDLKLHTDNAIIDIIHGEGGSWELMRRLPENLFNNYEYTKIGDRKTPHGRQHTYYKVRLNN